MSGKLTEHQIKEGDPLVTEIFKELYAVCLSKNPDHYTAVEYGIVSTIQKGYRDNDQVERRQIEGLVSVVKSILEKRKHAELSDDEKQLYSELENLVFLRLNGESERFHDGFNKVIHKALTLDFSTSIPVVRVRNKKRNIFSFISFSFNTLIEKIKFSTVSVKAVNNMLEHLTDLAVVVVDSRGSIRFASNHFLNVLDLTDVGVVGHAIDPYCARFCEILDELDTHGSISNLNVKLRSSTGSHLNAVLNVTPIKRRDDDEGEIDEIVLKFLVGKNESTESSLKWSELMDAIDNADPNHVIGQPLDLVNNDVKDEEIIETVDVDLLINTVIGELRQSDKFINASFKLDNRMVTPLYANYNLLKSLITTLLNFSASRQIVIDKYFHLEYRHNGKFMEILLSQKGQLDAFTDNDWRILLNTESSIDGGLDPISVGRLLKLLGAQLIPQLHGLNHGVKIILPVR